MGFAAAAAAVCFSADLDVLRRSVPQLPLPLPVTVTTTPITTTTTVATTSAAPASVAAATTTTANILPDVFSALPAQAQLRFQWTVPW